MTILILERVQASLRGELTRWMIQPKTGVFVGWLSARVRKLLWFKTIGSIKNGAALLIYTDNNEQGFTIQRYGDTSKVITDFEGLLLPKTPISG
jgi:CRISPR-associated protein Cas2